MSSTRQVEAAQAQLFDARVGAREKYQRLVVGRSGWGALLTYELVNLIAQWVPGALGLALRKTMYPWLLGACGRGVVFGQHVTLRHPHRIRIGDDVVIDDHCLLDAKGEGHDGITIGRPFSDTPSMALPRFIWVSSLGIKPLGTSIRPSFTS